MIARTAIAAIAFAGTVAANPAAAAGLNDRGRIALGLRADLVRVGDAGGHPFVRATWRQGERVF
jgi:alpha-D-ribose 1-methylphosphonate 5-triphosphate diphosphatase